MKSKLTLLIFICAITFLPNAKNYAEDKADGAKKLYEQGLAWKAEAGLINRKSHYLNAIKAWKELLEKYPESKRCGEVAYYIGDLYESVYLRENTKAVEYYEIAIKKEPEMKRDVYYRLAYICHKRLKDDKKAIKYYQIVIDKTLGYEKESKHKEKAIKALAKLKAEE